MRSWTIKRNDRQVRTDHRERQQGKKQNRSSQANDSLDVQMATVRVSWLPGLPAGFEAALAALSTV